MNTNEWNVRPSGPEGGLPALSGPLDPSILAAMAADWFPEFSAPGPWGPAVPPAMAADRSPAFSAPGQPDPAVPGFSPGPWDSPARRLPEGELIRAAGHLSGESFCPDSSAPQADPAGPVSVLSPWGDIIGPAGTGRFQNGVTGLDLGPDAVLYPAAAPQPARPAHIMPGGFDVEAVRRDFPILSEQVNGKPLVWLDNAATTQKPKSVIDRIRFFYEHENSNIHRGAHTLAARATDAYEAARNKVARFINAASAEEILFVRGTTEAINLAAQSYGRRHLKKGDEIVLSQLEHHANIVPWQMLCAETGARLRIIPVDERGQLSLPDYEALLGPRTKLVSVAHVSNVLGTVTPVAELTAMAHRYGATVLIDGAQAVSHLPVDVRALDCDFYAFSGHKLFGPTGIGALYAKSALLRQMRPSQGGGNMIVDVTFEKTLYQEPPARFEAGTGSIAAAVGLGAAIDYLSALGMDRIFRYEQELLRHGTELLRQIPGLTLIGQAQEKAAVLSFVISGISNDRVGAVLNAAGIAARAGHHCAQPILRRYGLEGAVRPSLAFYNTREELDYLYSVLKKLADGRILPASPIG